MTKKPKSNRIQLGKPHSLDPTALVQSVDTVPQPKNVPISIGASEYLLFCANRFKIETYDKYLQIYFAYQDKYEKTPSTIASLTMSHATLFEYFVNKNKENFSKTVDLNRKTSGNYTLLRLTEDELRNATISNVIVNIGGLAISRDGGGEAWFGTYSPWEISQIPSLKPGQIPTGKEMAANVANLSRCIMMNETFIQFWDELLQVANGIGDNHESK